MRILAPAFVFLSFFCGGGAIAAVPPNDSFSARAPVTMAGSSATNVDATVEAGEPAISRDSATAGTIWWSFTPATSGWYEITTSGSEIDTVLAVYQGTALNTLVRVASADGDALNIALKTSRVWFHAAAGISYAVQAGGYNDQVRGAILLGIQPVAQPGDRVTSLTHAPGGLTNVTAFDQTVTITFSLEQSAALDFGILSLSRPGGEMVTTQSFSAADRIAGTAIAGTYRVAVTVPRYAPGGDYPLWITAFSVAAPDVPDLQAGGWVWNSLPSSVAPHLTVANTGSEDVIPPSLASASFSQSSVDVTASGILVSLTMEITDDLAGLTAASVSLEQTITPGQNAVLVAGTATSSNRTSGTATNGQYLIHFFIPQDAPAGAWQLHAILTDRVGNRVSVAPPTTLTVTKNPYAAWTIERSLNGPAADAGADPDHDGHPNLEEFAFHTDPKNGNFNSISLSAPDWIYLFQGALPLQYSAGDRLHLRFLRRRGANAGAMTTAAQFGSDFSQWTEAADLTVTPLSADWEMVDARDSATISTTSRRLGRVLVTLP